MNRANSSRCLAFLSACALSISLASAQVVFNPEFLSTLPRIDTAAQLDKFLKELESQPDPTPGAAKDWFLYRLKPFKGGYTPLILDSGGELAKYALWWQKAASGRYDQLVLVVPALHDELFAKEGRIPFDGALKKKILSAKGITDPAELPSVLNGLDVSDGTIRLQDLVAADLLGHYLPGTVYLDASGQPVEVRGTPRKIYTRVEADGRRVAITERQFADTTEIAKTRPRINWTVENYAVGATVDPQKLLREGEALFFHTGQDPEIAVLYEQQTQFTDATAASHNSAPKAIVSSDALKGSRLGLLTTLE